MHVGQTITLHFPEPGLEPEQATVEKVLSARIIQVKTADGYIVRARQHRDGRWVESES